MLMLKNLIGSLDSGKIAIVTNTDGEKLWVGSFLYITEELANAIVRSVEQTDGELRIVIES